MALTLMDTPAIFDELNEARSINKANALDAFQLFYEELISSKRSNRIRRVRRSVITAE